MGFSLVELLIVIGIVALLISMLMPTLSKARDAALSSTCKSQERQILITFAGYLNDWKQTYPFANPARPGYPNAWPAGYCYPWMMAVSKYLGGNKVLQCPANQWKAYSINDQSNPPSSYAMSSSTTGFPENWHDKSDPPRMVASRREQQLLSPSRTLLLGEVPNAQSAFGRAFVFNTMEYIPFYPRTEFSAPYPVGYWHTPEIAGRPGGDPIARVNHTLAWNSAMADGSVKTTTKNSLTLYAQQYGDLTVNSEGMMFWGNRYR